MIEDIIVAAKNITIISGAGLSKASGIPTFRDVDGLWEKFNSNDVSDINANILQVSKFYQDRYQEYKNCLPNPAHYACAELETLKTVFHATQNIDGLLQQAGCNNVVEIHGTMRNWYCTECNTDFHSSEGFVCKHCGSEKVRPDVVLFGEYSDTALIFKCIQAVKKCDVLFTVGTSGVVQPVSLWPNIAKSRGIPVVAISMDKPENHYDYWLSGKAEDILPSIVADIKLNS